jgi:cell division septation protein DedD
VTPKPVPLTAVAKANAGTAVPKSTTAPATAAAAAPAPAVPHEGFAIQVAAVRERDEADRIVARLVNQGYSGYLVRGQGAAAAFYRVRVGAFKDRQAAEEVAVRLERAEGVKPWIVKETP